jgi:hypothetical protein
MRKAWALRLLVDWFQLHLVLSAYHRLLQILLGEDHLVPQGIRMLVGVLEDAAPVYLNHEPKGAYKCEEVMTAVNTYMWSWADEQACSLAHVLPNFSCLAKQFQLGEANRCRRPTLDNDHSSGHCNGPTAGTDKNDAHVPGVFDANISVYWLLKTARPSKLPSGRMPCLNYHVHGSCSPTCPYLWTTSSTQQKIWQLWPSTWPSTALPPKQHRPRPEFACALRRRALPCQKPRAWAHKFHFANQPMTPPTNATIHSPSTLRLLRHNLVS